MKRLSIIVLCLFSGCSTLGIVDAINPLKEDKGIKASVQLGKENHSDGSKQLVKLSTQETETNLAEGNQIINKNTNIPWWTALLLLFVRPLVILKDTIDLFKRGKR